METKFDVPLDGSLEREGEHRFGTFAPDAPLLGLREAVNEITGSARAAANRSVSGAIRAFMRAIAAVCLGVALMARRP